MNFFSLSALSKFYSNMITRDKKQLSQKYSLNHEVLKSWLYCLSDLRNTCAHQDLLYNKTFVGTPLTPKSSGYVFENNTFDYILLVKGVLKLKSVWKKEILPSLIKLMKEYIDVVELSHLGFPSNWEDILNKI